VKEKEREACYHFAVSNQKQTKTNDFPFRKGRASKSNSLQKAAL
jgi:hypothetical protein